MSREQQPSTQLPERKKLRIQRIIFLSVFLVTLLWLFIYAVRPAKAEDSRMETTYYSSLNESSCTIEIDCNRKVRAATAQIEFYATEGARLPLCTQTVELHGYNTSTLTAYAHDIPGNAEAFKITKIDIEKSNTNCLLIIACACIPSLYLFFCTMCLSCNVYRYKDTKIVVYAGWYHHYILINGEKYDEHNTLISFTPITLTDTLDDGSEVKATISLTNRVALKINGKLFEKERESNESSVF